MRPIPFITGATDMSLQQVSTASPEVAREILRAIEGLRYGSLEIVVHDGRVTQIEKREKVRFPQDSEKTR